MKNFLDRREFYNRVLNFSSVKIHPYASDLFWNILKNVES